MEELMKATRLPRQKIVKYFANKRLREGKKKRQLIELFSFKNGKTQNTFTCIIKNKLFENKL